MRVDNWPCRFPRQKQTCKESHDDQQSIGGDSTISNVAFARRLDQLFRRIFEVAAATSMLLCLAPILLITSVAIDSILADLFSSERCDATARIERLKSLNFDWWLHTPEVVAAADA
jgi:lipopolysaccharide/colanic/teichoic acid biosynthesis glycosyltransferase